MITDQGKRMGTLWSLRIEPFLEASNRNSVLRLTYSRFLNKIFKPCYCWYLRTRITLWRLDQWIDWHTGTWDHQGETRLSRWDENEARKKGVVWWPHDLTPPTSFFKAEFADFENEHKGGSLLKLCSSSWTFATSGLVISTWDQRETLKIFAQLVMKYFLFLDFVHWNVLKNWQNSSL